jgi:uncharacterized integral membrane protein
MVQQTPGPANTAPTGGAPQASSISKGLLATLAGGGLLVVFVVQNRDDVTLNFLFWSFSVPMWLFTIGVAVLGSIVWIGIGMLRRHRRRKDRRADRND